MAPTKEKRGRARVKKAPSVKTQGRDVVRMGHTVCVSSVPSALCAKEPTVRNYFGQYGELLSVTIHHNFLDMKPDGFMYLEYANKEDAEAAVAAVKEKSVGLVTSSQAKAKRAVDPSRITGMKAALALQRGEPKFEADEQIKDILLGRREGTRFSQSQREQAMDDDDLILQSLSQPFISSQPKKRKKRRKSSDEAATPNKPKKPKKIKRSSKVAVPTEE